MEFRDHVPSKFRVYGLMWPEEIQNPESLVVVEDPSAESWNAVYRNLVRNKIRIRKEESVRLVCETLLRKMDEVGCRDKKTAWNIAQWIAYCLNYFEGQNAFRNYRTMYTVPLEGKSDILHLLLDHPSHGFKVQLRLRFRNPEIEEFYLKFLLNYDFLSPIDVDNELSHDDISRAVWACYHSTPEFYRSKPEFLSLNAAFPFPEYYPELRRRLNLTVTKIDRQIDLVEEQLRSSNSCGLNDAFQRGGYKRLMLTAKCIHVLEETYRQTDGEPYAQCIRLYFRCIPDPFVQAEEVREFLNFFLQDTALEEWIDAMVTLFQRWFPESIAPYGPRSLQHLCRCRVRELLSLRSEVLPELLNNLKIPHRLKVYILGDS